MGISRRELLEHFGRGAACLAVSNFIGLKGASGQSAGGSLGQEPEVDYRKWEDLYRKQWTWDKIVHSTHEIGCFGLCEWNVFVKDGVAFKEEQIEHPRSRNPEHPDPGPQGCQRGACCTNQMYGPDRIKYPLKRIGKRGEGKWMRVSWDEALTEAADAMIDAIVKDNGARTISIDFGDETPPCWRRWFPMLGVIQADNPVTAGDQQMGYYATYGSLGSLGSGMVHRNTPREILSEDGRVIEVSEPEVVTGGGDTRSALFGADLIFIWHANVVQTLIPYYKVFAQARYRGAQIITVAPDLSPSTIHADYWIPVEPGTDIALALGMCQVIVEEKLYRPGFLKEQTDLPFLAREDTQKFLRQTDLESGGREDQFYVYDLKTQKVVPARRDTLELGSVDPALEGRYEVALTDGRRVSVRPVFERLKEMLNKDYKPEQAAELISKPFAKVHPDVIREVARKAAKAKFMRLETGTNASKMYHLDLINRSIALFSALSGHARQGGFESGFWRSPVQFSPIWGIFQGMERPGVEAGVEAYHKGIAVVQEIMREDPTMTVAMAQVELAKPAREGRKKQQVPGWQWMYYRGGFKDRWDNKQWHDPHYREFSSYVEEANKKGWFDGYIGPDKEKVPLRDRVLLSVGGDFLRRNTGTQVYYDSYIPSLEKIIDVDYRMSATSLYADLVLPAAHHYEQTKSRKNSLWLMDKVVEPLGEAKPDWDIICLLSKKISERAKQRGITKIYDRRREETLELDKLYDRFTIHGAYGEGALEKVTDLLYRIGASLGFFQQGLDLEGVRRAKGIPPLSANPPSETLPPVGGAVARSKLPFATLTRRMQFYLDHDWFIEAGEALPVHRPHPLLGGNYPFHQTGGHGRESVHSMWIANPLILRLTRGVPSLFMNKEEAERLGIGDFEEVEVYNDAGVYRVRVKHSALVRPNQVVIYHCWENYQFSKGHWNAVNPCTAKPLLLAGGYGHLTYVQLGWQPETARRGARVNIRKLRA